MVDLGEIQRVDLREVWPHEAQDFTPWLAENLDKLGKVLGLDLELRASEAAVGLFSEIYRWMVHQLPFFQANVRAAYTKCVA